MKNIHYYSKLFTSLLRLYTGTCVAADDAALHAILEAAMFLQIPPLIEAASEVLQRRLSPATALATWGLADRCSLEQS